MQLSLILADDSSTVLDTVVTIVKASSAVIDELLIVIDLLADLDAKVSTVPVNSLGTLSVSSFITVEVVFAVASGPFSISDVVPDPISSIRMDFCEPQVTLGGKSDKQTVPLISCMMVGWLATPNFVAPLAAAPGVGVL